MEEEIRTKRLIIVDNDGNPKIEMRTISDGDPQIILWDKKGVPSIRISIDNIDDNEVPTIALIDSESTIPGTDIEGFIACSNELVLTKDRGNMILTIGSGLYGNRIVLGVDKNNNSSLFLIDEDNQLKAAITSSNDSEYGDVLLFKNDGKTNASLSGLFNWAMNQNK